VLSAVEVKGASKPLLNKRKWPVRREFSPPVRRQCF
jgi:hypothetical protein